MEIRTPTLVEDTCTLGANRGGSSALHIHCPKIASQAHSTFICYLFFSEVSNLTFSSVSLLAFCICIANTWEHCIGFVLQLWKPCTLYEVHSVYTTHQEVQRMSFFGFDPAIPRGGHPDKAPGFGAAPDPFAGISQHQGTGYEDEDA